MPRSWRCCNYDTTCHLINYLKLHKTIQDSNKPSLYRRPNVHWTPVNPRQVASRHVIKIGKRGFYRWVRCSSYQQYSTALLVNNAGYASPTSAVAQPLQLHLRSRKSTVVGVDIRRSRLISRLRESRVSFGKVARFVNSRFVVRRLYQPQHPIATSVFLTGELREFRALRSHLRPESMADNEMGRPSQIRCWIALFHIS